MKYTKRLILFILLSFLMVNIVIAQNIKDQVDHHYVNNDGVKIHYVTMGEGPMLLFVHGFPDFWYTWRHQMSVLSKTNKVVAVDLRGYNLSDKPKGVKNYLYEPLMKDLEAVIKDAGSESAYVIAHDWGAAISWRFAAHYPNLVKKLIILNISHPKSGNKKCDTDLKEGKPSYADYFVSKEFDKVFTENWYSGWIKDPKTKEIYKEAFRKSDKVAMLNYYRANATIQGNLKNEKFLKRKEKLIPNIKMPVLIIHGKKDTYAPTAAHNNTWDYIDNELTIEVLPNAGHFTHRDESDKVTNMIKKFILKSQFNKEN